MVTLRMVCIAVALLVAIPVGIAFADGVTVPGGELANAALHEAATVTDIDLITPPQKYDRVVNDFRPEQLVEGHIVFITIDIPLIANVSNFTFDIVGNVSCSTHFNGSGNFFGGIIPVPNRIDEAHEECQAAGRTFVTPDPFIDSDNQTLVSSSLTPTGVSTPFVTPNGQPAEATEYYYDITARDWLGEITTYSLYAWSTPVMDPWVQSDGRQMNWYCPISEERLSEMGIHEFKARHESEMDGVNINE